MIGLAPGETVIHFRQMRSFEPQQPPIAARDIAVHVTTVPKIISARNAAFPCLADLRSTDSGYEFGSKPARAGERPWSSRR